MTTQKVTVRYLIDVAIGSPEPGIVNFNALYTVLLAISEKLDLQEESIEVDNSFCAVAANALESKSNLSSERLIDHQVFDFDSDTGNEKVWPKDKSETEFKATTAHLHQENQLDDRKVAFNAVDSEAMSHSSSKRVKDSDRLSNYRSELRQHIDALNARLGKIEDVFAMNADTNQALECIRQIVDQFQVRVNVLEGSINDLKDSTKRQDHNISACRIKLEHDKLSSVVDELYIEMKQLKEVIGKTDSKIKQATLFTQASEASDHKSEYSKLQGQVFELKTDVCSLTEKLKSMETTLSQGRNSFSNITPEMIQGETNALKTVIQKTEAELAAFQAEYSAQKVVIDDFAHKLADLMSTRIDREEIDELLSEKADYTMLQRKVSVENLGNDRRKLEKQISEIAECFVLNDERVQKQIGDIKKFLGDQSLEDMLFDFKVKVDKEIQVVRDGIRKLANMKPEMDAAAARLRDLTCLSCDQDVVMRAIELNTLCKFDNAYVTKSVGPSVTFEIGNLREIAKIGGMETSLTMEPRSLRHTGGQHTIVTNQDRVTKIKHGRRK